MKKKSLNCNALLLAALTGFSAISHLRAADLPLVQIVAPDATAFEGASSVAFTLMADASDHDDAVRSVSFYANDHFLGRTTISPYSLIWSNVPGGEYALFARAVDVFRRATLSSPVHFHVINPNLPPTISLLSAT